MLGGVDAPIAMASIPPAWLEELGAMMVLRCPWWWKNERALKCDVLFSLNMLPSLAFVDTAGATR
jgi:hypothetical protein